MDRWITTKEDLPSSLLDPNDQSLVIPLNPNDIELDAEEESKTRLYGFKIGSVGLLVGSEVHSEVVEGANIAPIPLMPSHVLGLCNVRGNLAPVYDLVSKMGFESVSDNQKSKRILMLGESEEMVGLEIQDLLVSLLFDDLDQVEDVPSVHDQLNAHIRYCYKKDGEFWFGFDHITLFESL